MVRAMVITSTTVNTISVRFTGTPVAVGCVAAHASGSGGVRTLCAREKGDEFLIVSVLVFGQARVMMPQGRFGDGHLVPVSPVPEHSVTFPREQLPGDLPKVVLGRVRVPVLRVAVFRTSCDDHGQPQA